MTTTRPVARWELALDLARSADQPLFLAIARGLSEAIRAGRLTPGERLPGARTLAAELGVHRNTVIAAFDELVAEGWLEARPARGTFVATETPSVLESGRDQSHARRGRHGSGARLGVPGLAIRASEREPPFEAAPRRGVVRLDGGTPDLRLAPVGAMARAYRRVLRKVDHLAYGDPRGSPRLRAALAGMLERARGIAVGPDELLVTRGSQSALDLIARALVRPGDRVAFETLGYAPARGVFVLAGATPVPIPVDAQGLDVDALARAHAEAPIRAVYLTPHHHFPTTVTLSPWRREQLMRMATGARPHPIVLIEDDYDHEFHFRGRPILPLKSVDAHGVVAYVGTLSKLLAPGLRLGYVVAPAELLRDMTIIRELTDRQGDHAVEAMVAELFEDGEMQRHARRMKNAYAERRETLLQALERELGDVLEVTPSGGGMALWAALRTPWASLCETWAARAEALGVKVATGREFTFDGRPRANFRIGFALASPDEIRLGVKRMKRALSLLSSGEVG